MSIPPRSAACLRPLFPMCPPGTCWAYQNIAFDVAHEAIEKATGESYDQAAHEYAVRPARHDQRQHDAHGLMGRQEKLGAPA
jgi:beta-lactamase class C